MCGIANGLRRHVAGVPVILMARVQDVAEIGRLERADDRAAIHHAGDALEPLRDLDVVDGGIDAGERAQHALGANTRLERRIALRIERLGLRHATGHPEHDDGIGGRVRLPCACSERGSRPTSAESVAPAVAPMNAGG